MDDWQVGTKLRTRLLWLMMRAVSLDRRMLWARRGYLRWARPILGRGQVSILGGLAVRLRLDAASFSPSGAQAYPVLTGTHEIQVQQAILRSIAEGDVVWDVGANIGFLSLVASRLVGDAGMVVAIEPDPTCAAAVRRAVHINRLSNLTVVEAAASARSGTGELIVVADSLWSRLSTVGEHDQATHRISVRTVALDDLQAPAPTVIKLDVEGAELDVLDGMQRLLSETRPILICEMHGNNKAFCAAMTKAKYSVRNLDGKTPVERADGNVHAICEPIPDGPPE